MERRGAYEQAPRLNEPDEVGAVRQEIDRMFQESDAEVVRILSLYIHELRMEYLDGEE